MKKHSGPNLHRKIPMNTLRILVAIDEQGNFTRAAEQVTLVVSAVSRRIQELEELLGVALLHRSPHQISFTEAGKVVLERARRILLEVDGIAADLASLEDGVRGQVALAASIFSLFEALPFDLANFNRAFPQIRVNFQSMASLQVIESLYGKQIDVGIFSASRPPAGLQTTLYYEDKLTVLAPAKHPLAGCASLTLAQISPYDLVGPPAGTETERLLTEQFRQQGMPLKMPMRVASLDAMVLMTQAGLGLCIVPEGVWERLGPFPEIVRIPISESEPWAFQRLYVGIVSDTPAGSPVHRLYRHLARSPSLEQA